MLVSARHLGYPRQRGRHHRHCDCPQRRWDRSRPRATWFRASERTGHARTLLDVPLPALLPGSCV